MIQKSELTSYLKIYRAIIVQISGSMMVFKAIDELARYGDNSFQYGGKMMECCILVMLGNPKKRAIVLIEVLLER